MLRPIIHLMLHLIVPGVTARLVRKTHWMRAWLVMMGAMVIDLDHLLTTPVFDPNRCSIGFHPLHTHLAIAAYTAAALYPRTRILGIGLLIHVALDALDCFWMTF